jgi:archaeal flagellar protein FlaJ
MNLEIKENIQQMKEILKEINSLTFQLERIKNLETNKNSPIEYSEKKLLEGAIIALTNQLKILNNSLPELLKNLSLYSQLPSSENKKTQKLIKVNYQPPQNSKKISLTITEGDRKLFLENLSKSHLSINQLKKKYKLPKPTLDFGRANPYAKISNRIFRKTSINLTNKNYFQRLNRTLRKINSPFLLGTYVSMIFFTVLWTFILGIFFATFFLFFNLSLVPPSLSLVEGSLLLRFTKVFWIVLILPILSGFLFYIYPLSESKSLKEKIDQELPFVVMHISAIAISGIEPTNIFKILLKNNEYKYTNTEFRKIMNLVNFHGKDLVSALREVSQTSPSSKLRELLSGIATTITSGGSIGNYLKKHSENLLFIYKLEREKSTKTAETMMDIYIAIAIAAPMILILLFVIMSSIGTLGDFLGLSITALSFLIILAIALINILFLGFLKIKQPSI